MEKTPDCSFCDNPPGEGRSVRLVGSTGLHICNECVGSPNSQPPHASAISCSSCGYCHYHLRQSTKDPGVHVCEQCIDNLSDDPAGSESRHAGIAGERRCSFCRKSQSQVAKLNAGPSHLTPVHICNECIARFAAQ